MTNHLRADLFNPKDPQLFVFLFVLGRRIVEGMGTVVGSDSFDDMTSVPVTCKKLGSEVES